jgi:hypothetical protein
MHPVLNLHPRLNAHALIACNCNSNQSFADYFKQYHAFHGFLLPKLEGESKATITTHGETHYDEKSKLTAKFVQYEESIVKVRPATLKFQCMIMQRITCCLLYVYFYYLFFSIVS